MSGDDLAYLSVGALRSAFQARAVSPVDVMQSALRQIEVWEPSINAFVNKADEAGLLAQARLAEGRWLRDAPLGPLDGVPVTLKDSIQVGGFPTRRGSKTSDKAATDVVDSPAAARLREAGAIIIGKTTTSEFGWKTVTDSPLSGITRNPWNLSLTPGGSSGGSAAAMAAGIGYAAIGTDAAGSIRVPCAFTGLVGFKATAGRIPRFPTSSLGALGHVGPMARTVEDVILIASLISRDDARDWNSFAFQQANYPNCLDGGLAGLRVAYSPDLGVAKVDPEVAFVVERAVGFLSGVGLKVEVTHPPISGADSTFSTLFAAAYSYMLSNISPPQRALLDPGLVDMVDRLGTPSLGDYLAALERQAALGRSTRAFHERFDLLCTPTVSVPAFSAGCLAPEDWEEAGWMSWTPFTYPFNLTGQPAITIPCGYTKAGLPVGLQLVGGFGADALVLSAARAFESLLLTGPAQPRQIPPLASRANS